MGRTCTNPAPRAGGRDCVGDATITKECMLKECTIDFGGQCDFLPMDRPKAFKVNLEQGNVEQLVKIPVGMNKVFVRLHAEADLDIQLVAEGADEEEPIISFLPYKNWGDSEAKAYGMTVRGCTDNCDVDLTATYHGDDLEHTVKGDNSFKSEYIYVDRVTVPLILRVQAYQSGVGTVTYGYDCAAGCSTCHNVLAHDNGEAIASM